MKHAIRHSERSSAASWPRRERAWRRRLGARAEAAIRQARVWALLFCAVGVSAQPDTWTINGKAMPVQEFIAQVADITGKTIVADQRIKNQEVTIFSSVPFNEEAVYELFLTVLRVNNYIASEHNDVITVAPVQAGKFNVKAVDDEAEQPADLMVTRVVPVHHVPSSELVKTLRPLVSNTAAHIAAIAEPNVLIIADYASNMRRVLSIVRQIDLVDPDEIVHRMLEHAWVGSVVVILEELEPELFGANAKGPQAVRIVANERNNSIILKGKARPIAKVLRIIDGLDVPETSTGGATVIHLNHADAEKLAEVLDSLSNDLEGKPTATIRADTSLNALIVRADPTTLNELLATISQLDVRRPQVLIEVAVVEVSVNDIDTRGVEIAAGDAQGKTVPLVSTSLNGIISGLLTRIGETKQGERIDPVAVAAGLTSPTIAVAKLNRQGVSFSAVVSALLTDTRANLLSIPSVLTLDNATAKYFSGQQVPFRTGSYTTTTDGARNPFNTLTREKVGVTLEVTPHIHDDLSLRLVLKLTVGNVIEDATSTNTNMSDPLTAERELEATVLADDRQIILLGGLIQDDYRNTQRKVPLLGDVPLLGRAFRSKRETLMKSHLLMFLRPMIITSGEDAQTMARNRYRGVYGLRGTPAAPAPENLADIFDGTHLPDEADGETPDADPPRE